MIDTKNPSAQAKEVNHRCFTEGDGRSCAVLTKGNKEFRAWGSTDKEALKTAYETVDWAKIKGD